MVKLGKVFKPLGIALQTLSRVADLIKIFEKCGGVQAFAVLSVYISLSIFIGLLMLYLGFLFSGPIGGIVLIVAGNLIGRVMDSLLDEAAAACVK